MYASISGLVGIACSSRAARWITRSESFASGPAESRRTRRSASRRTTGSNSLDFRSWASTFLVIRSRSSGARS